MNLKQIMYIAFVFVIILLIAGCAPIEPCSICGQSPCVCLKSITISGLNNEHIGKEMQVFLYVKDNDKKVYKSSSYKLSYSPGTSDKTFDLYGYNSITQWKDSGSYYVELVIFDGDLYSNYITSYTVQFNEANTIINLYQFNLEYAYLGDIFGTISFTNIPSSIQFMFISIDRYDDINDVEIILGESDALFFTVPVSSYIDWGISIYSDYGFIPGAEYSFYIEVCEGGKWKWARLTDKTIESLPYLINLGPYNFLSLEFFDYDYEPITPLMYKRSINPTERRALRKQTRN